MPINLRYYSGGVLLEQHPSWVGQNWTLEVGGVVTRKMNGGIDEVYTPDFSDPNIFSYYFKYDKLNNPQWDQKSYMDIFFANPSNQTVLLDPDEFMFTLPNGKSGSIMLDHLGIWRIKSEHANTMKAEVSLNSSQLQLKNAIDPVKYYQTIRRIIYRIDIIDDDGTRYTFGNNINAIEFMRNRMTAGLSMDNVIANSWFLTKITSSHGNVVNFEYERGPHQFVQNAALNYTSSYSITNNNNLPRCSGSNVSNIEYSGRVLTPVYLRFIKSETFSVEFRKEQSHEIKYPYELSMSTPNGHSFNNFNYSDFEDGHYSDVKTNGNHLIQSNPHRDFKLKEILIKDLMGNTKETYNFNYNNDTIAHNDQRLFLLSFDKKVSSELELARNGVVDSVKPIRYEFSYNNLDKLPGYNTLKVDESGYFNNIDIRGLELKQKFKSVLHFARVGSLISIKYPTGGRTNYYYGLNDFSSTVQKGKSSIDLIAGYGVGGGLRVDSIENISNVGQKQVVKYIYKKTGTNISSGISAGKLSNHYQYEINSQNNVILSVADIVSSYSMDNIDYTKGRPIVYSQVQEVFEDNSKNIYTYSNWDSVRYRDRIISQVSTSGHWTQKLSDGRMNGGTFVPSVNNVLHDYEYLSLESERGKLLKLEKTEGDVVRYSQVNTYYSDEIRFQNYIRSYVRKTNRIFCSFLEVIQVQNFPKKIFTYVPYLNSTSERFYNKAGVLENTKTISYSYNNLGLLSSESHIGSDNKNHTINYNYISDFPSLAAFNGMKAKNMLSKLVEKEVKVGGVILQREKNNYDFVARTQNYELKSREIWIKNSLAKRISYEYGDYGNLVEEKNGIDMPSVSYLWAYKGQYPVLKASNLSYKQMDSVLTSSFINNLLLSQPTEGSMQIVDNKIKSKYPNVMTNIQLYDPLVGKNLIVDERGGKQSYHYDKLNRLILIQNLDQDAVKAFDYNLNNISTDIPSPPIHPITLYAKLKAGNKGTINANGIVKTYTPYIVSFYSDPACTIPFKLLFPVQIKFREKTTISSNVENTKVLDYDYYLDIEEGVSSKEFTSGWEYCEGGLLVVRPQSAEELEKAKYNILAKGLPPGEGGEVITCYNSVITLYNWIGYDVK